MSEWNEYKLSDLTTKIGSGSTPRGGSNSYKDFGISLIRSQNVLDFSFTPSNLAFIDDKQADELKGVTVNENDILFNITGDSVARCCIVPKHILPARVNQHVAIIRTNDLADYRFIFYYLQFLKPELLISAEIGATRNAITKGMLENIILACPPLPEQNAIASVLSSLDDKIDLLHRQNATLEKMAETLFRQWFVEEAKEEWEEGKLGDVLLSIESGSRPKGGIDPDLKQGIPSIGAESINGIGAFDFSKTRYIENDFFEKAKRGVIQDYDVLIYKDGAYVGRKGMFGNGFPFKKCMVNEHVFILRSNDRINQTFLYFLLQEDELAQLNANSAQPGLNQNSMKSFEIVIPPKNKISEFEQFVKPWIDKILLNSNNIRILTLLRESLLPKLMSGEIRL